MSKRGGLFTRKNPILILYLHLEVEITGTLSRPTPHPAQPQRGPRRYPRGYVHEKGSFFSIVGDADQLAPTVRRLSFAHQDGTAEIEAVF